MSDKYIINNCPAILRMTKICDDYRTTRDNPELCKNIKDCLLKQIVELCKDAFKWQYAGTAHDAQLRYAKADFANELLSKLDIQEVE